MAEASDDILIARLNAGDSRAFTEIYNRYYRPIFVTCLKAIRPRGKIEDAQEIVSTTFLKLYERREKMRSMKHVTNFLYLAIRTGSIDFLRAAGRVIEFPQDMAESQAVNDELDMALLERIMKEEAVLKMVHELPARCKEVVVLYYLEGLKYREIAERLRISPRSVENQLRYALDKLRMALTNKKATGMLLLLIAGLTWTTTIVLLVIFRILSFL